MADYKKYLKTALLGDEKIITYRQVARELKVHVNIAKEMLYDFHRDLKLKKPNSCHATYILSGLRRTNDSSTPGTAEGKDAGVKDAEGDEVMASSPFELSQGSSVGGAGKGGAQEGAGGKGSGVVRSIVLVPEEKLDEVKASFEILSSIHVYSIEPTSFKDLLILADNTLAVQRLDAVESPPQDIGKKYGSIINLHAMRRAGGRVAPLPAAPAAKAVKKATLPPAAAAAEGKKSMFPKKTASTVQPTAATTTATTAASAGQPKRAQADFFKSFGGAGSKKKDTKKEESSSSPAAPATAGKPKTGKSTPFTKSKASPPQLKKEDSSKMEVDMPDGDDSEEELRPSEEEDEVPDVKMTKTDPDEEEEEDEDEEDDDPDISPGPSNRRSEIAASNAEHVKRRAERSAKLKAMMDDSDDEAAAAAPAPTPPSAQPQDDDNDDDDEIPPPAQQPPPPQPPSPPAPTAAPGRRRVRRKVNKRVTTRDKEGYLVTQNEMVWESFSEDEVVAPPAPAKDRAVVVTKAGEKKEKEGGAASGGDSAAVKKKAAPQQKRGAGQQGNIMSFFGKK